MGSDKAELPAGEAPGLAAGSLASPPPQTDSWACDRSSLFSLSFSYLGPIHDSSSPLHSLWEAVQGPSLAPLFVSIAAAVTCAAEDFVVATSGPSAARLTSCHLHQLNPISISGSRRPSRGPNGPSPGVTDPLSSNLMSPSGSVSSPVVGFFEQQEGRARALRSPTPVNIRHKPKRALTSSHERLPKRSPTFKSARNQGQHAGRSASGGPHVMSPPPDRVVPDPGLASLSGGSGPHAGSSLEGPGLAARSPVGQQSSERPAVAAGKLQPRRSEERRGDGGTPTSRASHVFAAPKRPARLDQGTLGPCSPTGAPSPSGTRRGQKRSLALTLAESGSESSPLGDARPQHAGPDKRPLKVQRRNADS